MASIKDIWGIDQTVTKHRQTEVSTEKITDSLGNTFEILHDEPPPANTKAGAKVKGKHPKLNYGQDPENDNNREEEENPVTPEHIQNPQTLTHFSLLKTQEIVESVIGSDGIEITKIDDTKFTDAKERHDNVQHMKNLPKLSDTDNQEFVHVSNKKSTPLFSKLKSILTSNPKVRGEEHMNSRTTDNDKYILKGNYKGKNFTLSNKEKFAVLKKIAYFHNTHLPTKPVVKVAEKKMENNAFVQHNHQGDHATNLVPPSKTYAENMKGDSYTQSQAFALYHQHQANPAEQIYKNSQSIDTYQIPSIETNSNKSIDEKMIKSLMAVRNNNIQNEYNGNAFHTSDIQGVETKPFYEGNHSEQEVPSEQYLDISYTHGTHIKPTMLSSNKETSHFSTTHPQMIINSAGATNFKSIITDGLSKKETLDNVYTTSSNLFENYLPKLSLKQELDVIKYKNNQERYTTIFNTHAPQSQSLGEFQVVDTNRGNVSSELINKIPEDTTYKLLSKANTKRTEMKTQNFINSSQISSFQNHIPLESIVR